MHKLDYSLYFKIADDYLSYKGTFISYYENNLEQFCQDQNLESSQIISTLLEASIASTLMQIHI